MKRLLIIGISAGAMVLVAACSSSSKGHSAGHGGMSTGMSMPHNAQSTPSTAGAPASGPHNSADAKFATDMIPHHGQAVTMADMALARTSNAEIKQLANAIKRAQDPEIQQMSGWLMGWDEPVPSSTMGAHAGMEMPGMMSAKDMAVLDKATGASFDRMWVTMMTAHHNGAIAMGMTEIADGQNAAAKSLAQSIITSQSAEIATMQKLLTSLPS
ncbi:MAG: DUF305 domain-containing protein [Pseudonocardiales bacterium]|nr:MAG: DUF305 domain-containing protein [Pseudonocardiales bacterium]